MAHPTVAASIVDHLAIQTALALEGVSVMIVSGDTSNERLPERVEASPVVTGKARVRPGDADLARLADLINTSRNVTLFCGIGCADAYDGVLQLAQRLQAPVAYTLRS